MDKRECHYHKNMTDEDYNIVPLHERPEFTDDCCKLLNTEWPRSKTARLQSLSVSCDAFPTCLILINSENKVLGHCKLSLISWLKHSCFIESVIIDPECRCQGLGSKLLLGAEKYIASKGIKNVYLITKGQEPFYLKNGYVTIDPIRLYGINNLKSPPPPMTRAKLKERSIKFAGPPPPPMPPLEIPKIFDVRMVSRKTHLVKRL